MKLKCIIVDDEPIARKVLREFISDVEFLELVGEAENPLRALSMLNETPVDIIFLDINMPKLNGLDFLKHAHTHAAVIMTTAYPDYAVEAFELDVLDYLVKPIAFERFLKAGNKAREFKQFLNPNTGTNQLKNDHFFVKCNNLIEKVRYVELVYAEAMLNYVMLHTVHKKMMVYVTIKSLEEQLPSSEFIKVHKSFIVNRHMIRSIEGNMLDLGIKQITISQNLREKVMDEIVRDKMIRR
jgi:DNA-binding LytR/AlgR family response regulator